MLFTETKLKGAYIIQPEKHADERGHFARTWCRREFEEHGLTTDIAQCNTSFNKKAGTLRGMHFQAPPNEEIKLVRCTRGAIFDVIIDLRPGSPTYKQHTGVELTGENCTMFYIPRGFAHGFITLMDDSEIFYQMSEFYTPGAGRGVRWNDPAFAIQWPAKVQVILPRDAEYPDFTSIART